MGWKKALAVVGIVLVVILASAGVAVYMLSRPATLAPYHDTMDPAARDQQSKIALALGVIGIPGAVASVHGDVARAAYDMPPDPARTADDWQRAVLSTLGALAPESKTLVATQFANEKATMQWSVPTAKMLAYQANQIGADELEAAVTKTAAT